MQLQASFEQRHQLALHLRVLVSLCAIKLDGKVVNFKAVLVIFDIQQYIPDRRFVSAASTDCAFPSTTTVSSRALRSMCILSYKCSPLLLLSVVVLLLTVVFDCFSGVHPPLRPRCCVNSACTWLLLKICARLAKEAAAVGASFLALPECFNFIGGALCGSSHVCLVKSVCPRCCPLYNILLQYTL